MVFKTNKNINTTIAIIGVVICFCYFMKNQNDRIELDIATARKEEAIAIRDYYLMHPDYKTEFRKTIAHRDSILMAVYSRD